MNQEERKPFYNYNVKYDISRSDRDDDFIMFDSYLSAFETRMKSYLLNGVISGRDFDILMDKYGGC